jgi:ElaA protein
MEVQWKLTDFANLLPLEIYKILQLRSEVFILEQHCLFMDADNGDYLAWHLCAWADDKLIGYARIIPPGQNYKEPSIGRVLTSRQFRKQGIGKELMQRSISAVYNLFGKTSIQIGAQLYLKKFYEGFGFRQNSDVYFEDHIEHIKMILP